MNENRSKTKPFLLHKTSTPPILAAALTRSDATFSDIFMMFSATIGPIFLKLLGESVGGSRPFSNANPVDKALVVAAQEANISVHPRYLAIGFTKEIRFIKCD